MMLIGILYSSGYSRIISLNTTGLLYSKEFTTEMNRDNILLWRNEPQKMGPFELLYKGARMEAKNYPGYIQKEILLPMENKYQAVARKEIVYKNKVYFRRGDTLEVYPENTFYEVLYTQENGDTFTLYPRAQVNPQMGLIASPDIKRFLGKDLYSHVSSIPAPDQEREWSAPESHTIHSGDTMYLNDYVAILENVQREANIPGVKLGANDAAVRAHIKLLGKDKVYDVFPTYIVLIDDKMVGQIPEIVEDLGIKIAFTHIDPAAGKFTFQVTTTQKDYIIIKALEKPMINILWIGTLLLVIGLFMAILRRHAEFVKMREKGLE
jgi:cytochrome c-type biogenesis protein CcmF